MKVTVGTDLPPLWEIEEDDYGDPMITHTHATGVVPAYVISRWEGGTVAQCSGCMAYLELDEEGHRPPPPGLANEQDSNRASWLNNQAGREATPGGER
jgi:hypothetical protein